MVAGTSTAAMIHKKRLRNIVRRSGAECALRQMRHRPARPSSVHSGDAQPFARVGAALTALARPMISLLVRNAVGECRRITDIAAVPEFSSIAASHRMERRSDGGSVGAKKRRAAIQESSGTG